MKSPDPASRDQGFVYSLSAVLTDCAFYRFVRRCKDQLSFSLLCRINCPHALYELPEQFESCLVD